MCHFKQLKGFFLVLMFYSLPISLCFADDEKKDVNQILNHSINLRGYNEASSLEQQNGAIILRQKNEPSHQKNPSTQ